MNEDDKHIHAVGEPEFDQDNVLPEEEGGHAEDAADGLDGPVVETNDPDDGDDGDVKVEPEESVFTGPTTSPMTPATKNWPLAKILVFAAAGVIFAWVAWSTLFGDPGASSESPQRTARMGTPMQAAPSAPPPAPPISAPSAQPAQTPAIAPPTDGSADALALMPGQEIHVDAETEVAVPAPAVSAAMAARVTALDEAVDNLQSQMTEIQKQLKALAEHKPAAPRATRTASTASRHRKPAKKAEPTKKAAPKVARGGPTLKAVLPGQAWFQLSSGTTVTVGVGDEVAEYGRVTDIDANAGTVTFAGGLVAR